MYLMVSITKEPARLLRMGDLVARSGLSRQTLNHYVLLGLITEEARTASDRYLFGEGVLRRLARIGAMKRNRTLRQILECLREEEVR